MMKKFIQCGITGWCLEIMFTGIHSLLVRDKKLMGQTSLWMFPIYGCAVIFSPMSKILKNRSVLCRGIHYMLTIFAAEYSFGYILKKLGRCPWDYSKARFNINGLIRLDFAPCWFGAGLLFEKILRPAVR